MGKHEIGSYRNEANEALSDAWWTTWRVIPLVAFVLFALGGVGLLLSSGTKVGATAVERVVFENSYQRSESIKQQIATDEANLTEIERKLANPELDKSTRVNLEAQASAARVRLAAARSR